MNKNLAVIQKISQVAKIVCRVLFVCCIVGASLTLVGAIISAIFGQDVLFKLGDVSVYGLIIDNSTKLVAALISTMIMLIPAAILTKFAEGYFDQELKDGTPFTVEGAERIKKLGILTIVLPIASEIVAQIVLAIASNGGKDEVTSGGSIITGLILIFLHFVFKYGAEISASKTADAPAAPVPAAEDSSKEN